MPKQDYRWPRRNGILMHVSSLPGTYGIGDFGPTAYQFVDWLAETKQSIWQLLPLNPTGYGDNPFQPFSVFAGNPFFISLDQLIHDSWLLPSDFQNMPAFDDAQVMYGNVFLSRKALLDVAYKRFAKQADREQSKAFQEWNEQQVDWLNDFALFMALKDKNGGVAFTGWPKPLRQRSLPILEQLPNKYREIVNKYKFQQWLFFTQWEKLKAYTNSKGIQIMAELPFYTALDCSDVWAHPNLFQLDERGYPAVVAGVPPDYFSPAGQIWGNPIYDWGIHQETGFDWWVKRLKFSGQLYDICVLDSFRMFAGYWEIPGGSPTAENGRWVAGPGQAFFDAILTALPDLHLVVEDLGEITPDVIELRDNNDLPGMAVLQFAWTDEDDPFLPHHHHVNQVVYTGRSHNDTSIGWWQTAPSNEKRIFSQYLPYIEGIDTPNWALIRQAMLSIAHTCIVPLQDVFGFGSETRLNYPGRIGSNWVWRLPNKWFENDAKYQLAQYTVMYGRYPVKNSEGLIQ